MAVEEKLTEDDLFDVYEEVLDVAASWMDLGLALRARKPDLDVLSKEYSASPRDCLKGLLSGWLQGRYGPQTWKALCEAVARPAGGNNRTLAEEIARKHNVTLSSGPKAPEPRPTAAGYLDQVVTLKDIQLIKYSPPGSSEVKMLRLERSISACWERLAMQLDIEHDECESIAEAKLKNPDRCLAEVINRWLNRKGRKLTTWNHFLKAMKEADLVKQAENLEEALKYHVV